jgi:hypothetical protein
MLRTIMPLISGIVFPPLFPAVGAHLPVFGIFCDFFAMVVSSATALTFRVKANALIGMEGRRVKGFVAVRANWLPGIHSFGLRYGLARLLFVRNDQNWIGNESRFYIEIYYRVFYRVSADYFMMIVATF